jgi:hypothetical protein
MPPVPTNWRKRRSFPVTSVVALGLLVVIGVGAAVLTARGNAPLPTAAGATVLDEPVQTAADAAVVARLGLAIDAGAEAMARGALSPIVIRRAAAASVPALSWVPGTVQSTSGTIVSAAFRASRDRGVYAMRSSSGLCWFATSAVASASVARVRAGTFFVDRLGGRCAAVDVPTSGWARELDLFRPGAG